VNKHTQERIDGRGHTVRELFTGRRYGLEHYQREYDWTRTHVSDLLQDLSARFFEQWRPDHEREDVADYRPYFLGPFVTYPVPGVSYLVDGQQRFTTILLLLIHLRHRLTDQEDHAGAAVLDNMICTVQYGVPTFTVHVDEREPALRALRAGRDFPVTELTPLAVRTICQRYRELVEDFPAPLRGEALPFFVDWLLERVFLVEITARDRENGWEIFESMNDRGARLTPLDLLKSFLLSRADKDHSAVNAIWRRTMSQLAATDDQAPGDYIKTLLRARYAPSDPATAERISTAYHEWVRQNTDAIGLVRPRDYRVFIRDTIRPLADRYRALVEACAAPVKGLEPVFYNAANGFPHQLTLIMAAINPNDSDTAFREKARLVAAFCDLLLARRMANYAPLQSGDLTAQVNALIEPLRAAQSLEAVRTLLATAVASVEHTFGGLETFGLRSDNRKQVRYLLSRMTGWVETQCGQPDLIADYLGFGPTGRPYEIEHIWADHFGPYAEEAGTPERFRMVRNRFGALLLLPKEINAAFRDDPYSLKAEHYRAQNLLARSLHPLCYERNPSFRRFMLRNGLAEFFRPYPHTFGITSITERQRLYRALCERIWDPARLGLVVPEPAPAQA
jgi:Protein of unknown function DUF262/Protein of unknown function (DUF1524)